MTGALFTAARLAVETTKSRIGRNADVSLSVKVLAVKLMQVEIAVSAQLDGIKFPRGEDWLTLCQFNTKTAKHYFCPVSGIYAHHQRRSNPIQFGINLVCLAGVSPFDFTEVVVNDGVNHPPDAMAGPLVVGILRFTPS